MATLTTLPTWYVASNGLDITQWMIDFSIKMGRQHEIDRTESSTLTMTLDNRSGTFTPWNTNTYTFSPSNSNFVGTQSLIIEVLIATGTTVTYFWNSTNADPVTGAQQGGTFPNYAQMVGNSVTLAGFGTAGYNGTFTVVSSTPSSFTVNNTTTGATTGLGSTAKVTSMTLSGCPLVMNSLIEVGGVYPTSGGTFSQLYFGYVNVVQPDAPDELNSQTTVQANDVLKTFAARLLSNSDIYPNFATATYDQSAYANATQLYASVLQGATTCYVYSNLSGITGSAVSLKILDGTRSETVTGTWGTAVALGSGYLYSVTLSTGFAQGHGQGCFVANNFAVATNAVFYRGGDTSGSTAVDYFGNLNGFYGGGVNYSNAGAHIYDASGSINMNSNGWLASNTSSVSLSQSWTNSFWFKSPNAGDAITTTFDSTNTTLANLTVTPDGRISILAGAANVKSATVVNTAITATSTTVYTSVVSGVAASGTLQAVSTAGATVTMTYTSVTSGYYSPGFVAIPCLIFTINAGASGLGTIATGASIAIGSAPLTTIGTTQNVNVLDGNWHHVAWQYGANASTTINGTTFTGASTTLTVASTTGFPARGVALVAGSGGPLLFSYTSITSTTLAGCTLLSGLAAWTITNGATIRSASVVFVDGVIGAFGNVPTTVQNNVAYWGGTVATPAVTPTASASSAATFADMLFVNTSPLIAPLASTQYTIGSLLTVQEYVGQKIKDALTVAQFAGSTTGIAQGYLLCVGDTSAVNQSNVLDYILNHVETEQGYFFQNTSGQLTLLNRFYPQETPPRQISGSVVTIGDSGSLSAYYEPQIDILQDDLDVWNRAQVTTYAGSSYETGNSQSVALYGSRTIPKSSVYTVTTNDTTAIAQMLLYRYALPQIRVQKLTLSTKANANTPIQISLNLWDQVTFSRHGSGNSAFSKQMIVESIEHHFIADPGDMDTVLVLSPFELVTGSSTPDSGSVFRFSDGTHTYSHFATTGQDHFGG